MHEYTRVIGTDCHESLVRVRLELLTASSIDKSCVVKPGQPHERLLFELYV
jgi:hypothetical protein